MRIHFNVSSVRVGKHPLQVTVVSSNDHPEIMDQFYEHYDQAFSIAGEKETRAGFEHCLANNTGEFYEEVSRALGPYRELIGIVRSDDVVVGGFSIFCLPVLHERREHLTIHLSYIYVTRAYRGQGLAKNMLDVIRAVGQSIFPETHGTPSIFLEVNDPWRLSEDDAARDEALTGLSARKRARTWINYGARFLRFPYRQPPLSDGQDDEVPMRLAVLGEWTKAGGVPPRILHDHLQRFFAVSVLKNGDHSINPIATQQLKFCVEQELRKELIHFEQL